MSGYRARCRAGDAFRAHDRNRRAENFFFCGQGCNPREGACSFVSERSLTSRKDASSIMDALSLAAHVFLGTLAFGLGIGLDFVLVAVAKTRRPDVIRATYETVASYARWVGPLFLITVLIGFYEAARRHEALGAPWLLASYV